MMEPSTRSRLKILHLVSGDLWAGAETMAYNLLRRLNEYDELDLSVILLNDGRLAQELRSNGLNVHVIDENEHSFLDIFRKVRTIIGDALPAVIHTHRYKENLLALLISRCCRGIKLVSTQHGLPECHDKNAGITQQIKTRANFMALSHFFTTVAVSEDLSNVLSSRFGFRKNKVKVIHNGIELPPLPSQQKNTGPFVIGSSGRLFPIKDYPLMVEIARAVAATGMVDVRFELAGDGPERPAIEALVQRNGLSDRFILKGQQNDITTFYKGLDIYLNTSVHEGMPMTILEALAHGLPVIAPALGGIVEIIEDGKQGFLVGSRTPGDFAEKCLFLRHNRKEREMMARSARMKAEQAFSAEKMADQYYQLYRRTVVTS